MSSFDPRMLELLVTNPGQTLIIIIGVVAFLLILGYLIFRSNPSDPTGLGTALESSLYSGFGAVSFLEKTFPFFKDKPNETFKNDYYLKDVGLSTGERMKRLFKGVLIIYIFFVVLPLAIVLINFDWSVYFKYLIGITAGFIILFLAAAYREARSSE